MSIIKHKIIVIELKKQSIILDEHIYGTKIDIYHMHDTTIS